ncbi:hypothetical protein DHB64_13875 [Antarcticibacterium sp. W02-3]|nr:hypothetical protein [Antarcticibacterium sp. W02-3]
MHPQIGLEKENFSPLEGVGGFGSRILFPPPFRAGQSGKRLFGMNIFPPADAQKENDNIHPPPEIFSRPKKGSAG